MKHSLILLFALSLIVVGCSPQAQSEDNEKKAPSSTQQVIEGMTGKTAVDAGQRAKKTLKAVGEKENEDLDEVLGK